MYLVSWTIKNKSKKFGAFDYYQTHDTLEDAQTHYNDLLKRDDLYCAAISKPIEATITLDGRMRLDKCNVLHYIE